MPLDAWFAHPAALRALKRERGRDLPARPRQRSRRRRAGQGVERGGRDRTLRAGAAPGRGLRPPHRRRRRPGHGAARTRPARRRSLGGLRRCGFEAITMTRPYPWVEFEPHSWLARPDDAGALVGWRPGRFRRGRAGAAAPPDRRPLSGRADPARLPRPAADPLRPPRGRTRRPRGPARGGRRGRPPRTDQLALARARSRRRASRPNGTVRASRSAC